MGELWEPFEHAARLRLGTRVRIRLGNECRMDHLHCDGAMGTVAEIGLIEGWHSADEDAGHWYAVDFEMPIPYSHEPWRLYRDVFAAAELEPLP